MPLRECSAVLELRQLISLQPRRSEQQAVLMEAAVFPMMDLFGNASDSDGDDGGGGANANGK